MNINAKYKLLRNELLNILTKNNLSTFENLVYSQIKILFRNKNDSFDSIKIEKEKLIELAKLANEIEILIKSTKDLNQNFFTEKNIQNLFLYYIINDTYPLNNLYSHIKKFNLDEEKIYYGCEGDNLLKENEVIFIAIILKN
jgi:hypothetical protein